MANLDPSDINHLGNLASLPLSQAQKQNFASQISGILDSVNHVKSLDIKGLKPTAQVTNKTNELREDVVTACLTQEEALSGALKTHDGYFVVKAVISHD